MKFFCSAPLSILTALGASALFLSSLAAPTSARLSPQKSYTEHENEGGTSIRSIGIDAEDGLVFGTFEISGSALF